MTSGIPSAQQSISKTESALSATKTRRLVVKLLDKPPPNTSIHRCALSEFVNVPPVPHAHPVMPSVRPLTCEVRLLTLKEKIL